MNNQQQDNLEKLKETLTAEEMQLVDKMLNEQSNLQKKLHQHPILLALLGAVGLVSLLYGFEKIIDHTILANHPIYLLLFGFLILYLTGMLLKKL